MGDAEQNTRQPETICDVLDLLGCHGIQGDKLDSIGLEKI